jgi:hypothetical protein
MQMLQAQKCFTFFLIALFAATVSTAQKTTDDLGKALFQVFSTKNMAALDTLIPSAKDMMEFYTGYPGIDLSDRFEEKFEHHMNLFKKNAGRSWKILLS